MLTTTPPIIEKNEGGVTMTKQERIEETKRQIVDAWKGADTGETLADWLRRLYAEAINEAKS
jgi:hypothetical protein